MQSSRFDWRWVAAIVFIAILVGAQRLPWWIVMLTLGIGGGYLLYLGWQVWGQESGTSGRGKRVTYWRGQRIELEPERGSNSLPSLRSMGPALLYLISGGLLVISALVMLFQRV